MNAWITFGVVMVVVGTWLIQVHAKDWPPNRWRDYAVNAVQGLAYGLFFLVTFGFAWWSWIFLAFVIINLLWEALRRRQMD